MLIKDPNLFNKSFLKPLKRNISDGIIFVEFVQHPVPVI